MDYDKTLRKLLPPGRTEEVPRFMQTDPRDLGYSSSVSKSTEPTQFRRAANDNQVNKPGDSPFPWLDEKMDTTPLRDALRQHFDETVVKPHEEFIRKYDELHAFGQNVLGKKGGWTELNVARYNKMGRALGGEWKDLKFE